MKVATAFSRSVLLEGSVCLSAPAQALSELKLPAEAQRLRVPDAQVRIHPDV